MLISKSPYQGLYGKVFINFLKLKKMNLTSLNVQEMNKNEMIETEGGFLAFLVTMLVFAAATLVGLMVQHGD